METAESSFVTVVSGLPRSGTSMMMRMLEAGGVPIMTDGEREADVDNPKGYYELERIKNLEKETDKSYLREGRGKAVKAISFLILARSSGFWSRCQRAVMPPALAQAGTRIVIPA